jgi:hypothetical protein
MVTRRLRGPATARRVTTLGAGTAPDALKSLLEASGAKKPSKYGNTPTIVNGRRFASKKEAGRYCTLTLMEQAGEIRGLECQPRYPLVVNGVNIGLYVADFCYARADTGEFVVEDAKGYRTPVYRLKAKLMLALYGHCVREV